MPHHLSILEAQSPRELAIAADLFREYARSLPFPLDYQGFEEELASLPGKYAPPAGAIFIASHDDIPVGCIAMRPLTPMPGDPSPVCEMKRMYVRPTARGLSLGRLLATTLLDRARTAGYAMMKLDSESDFTPALTLYRSLGFVECPDYNNDPMPNTVWMSKLLSEPPARAGR
jgi:GNAT superfamily N-acetyltransferase